MSDLESINQRRVDIVEEDYRQALADYYEARKYFTIHRSEIPLSDPGSDSMYQSKLLRFYQRNDMKKEAELCKDMICRYNKGEELIKLTEQRIKNIDQQSYHACNINNNQLR